MSQDVLMSSKFREDKSIQQMQTTATRWSTKVAVISCDFWLRNARCFFFLFLLWGPWSPGPLLSFKFFVDKFFPSKISPRFFSPAKSPGLQAAAVKFRKASAKLTWLRWKIGQSQGRSKVGELKTWSWRSNLWKKSVEQHWSDLI